jgi:hypothetical protein
MRALARILLVYVPLVLLLLLQTGALLTLYAGKISGKNDTMIDLGTHVPGLRFGWPIIFVVALFYHLRMRGRVESRSS